MEKKTYIAPAMVSYQVNLKEGLLLYTSTSKADPSKPVETKPSGDWSDIWSGK